LQRGPHDSILSPFSCHGQQMVYLSCTLPATQHQETAQCSYGCFRPSIIVCDLPQIAPPVAENPQFAPV
jgi:hypothetical protein